jgi:hypothetical protein
MPEPRADAVTEAQVTIWHLFEDGVINEDHATEALLAIAVGVQRVRAGSAASAERSDGALAG